MADRVICPECGEDVDARGFSSHMKAKHGVEGATKDDAEEVIEQGDSDVDLPPKAHSGDDIGMVRERDDGALVIETAERVVVTDEDDKKELLDAIKKRLGGEKAVIK